MNRLSGPGSDDPGPTQGRKTVDMMEKLGLGGVVVCVGIIITSVVGLIINLVAIINTVDLPITGMFILRCVGVFVAPLGVILGLFF